LAKVGENLKFILSTFFLILMFPFYNFY